MLQNGVRFFCESNDILCSCNVCALKVGVISGVVNVRGNMKNSVNLFGKLTVCRVAKAEVFLFNVSFNSFKRCKLFVFKVIFKLFLKPFAVSDKAEDPDFTVQQFFENVYAQKARCTGQKHGFKTFCRLSHTLGFLYDGIDVGRFVLTLCLVLFNFRSKLLQKRFVVNKLNGYRKRDRKLKCAETVAAKGKKVIRYAYF